MTISKNIKQLVCGSVLFPLSNSLLNRKGIMNMYREALKTQKMSQEFINKIQLNKFQNVISYAYTNVPYYKEMFDSIGLKPGDIKHLKDIEGIPSLTRQDVIENRKQLFDTRYLNSIDFAEQSSGGPGEFVPFARFNKFKLTKSMPSGSTDKPTVLYENAKINASTWAQELRLRQWFNVKPGAKEARLSRIAADIFPNSTKVRLREIFWNQLLLPGVNLSEFDNRSNYHKITYFKPDVVWGLTSSLTNLAESMLNNNLKFSSYQPKVCVTWGAPLYDYEKKLIKRMFRCPVTNIYGSRDVGHIAALCPHGSMHINQETLYIETDKNIEGLSGIDDGEIIATTLEQTPMPLIRYRMGDIGEIKKSSCSCGMNLQVLKNIRGKTGEIFITQDGRMISPNFWRRTFMEKEIADAIKRFQIRYTKKGNVKILLVKHNAYTSKTEMTLKKLIKNKFNSDIKISINPVESIRPKISGKHEIVVHE